MTCSPEKSGIYAPRAHVSEFEPENDPYRQSLQGCLEKEIETIVDRIMATTNDTLIQRYEAKVDELEKQRAFLVEILVENGRPKGTFEENLELGPKNTLKPLENMGKR